MLLILMCFCSHKLWLETGNVCLFYILIDKYALMRKTTTTKHKLKPQNCRRKDFFSGRNNARPK